MRQLIPVSKYVQTTQPDTIKAERADCNEYDCPDEERMNKTGWPVRSDSNESESSVPGTAPQGSPDSLLENGNLRRTHEESATWLAVKH